MSHELIADLKSQSTWKLFGLSVITFFVFTAHYMKRQTSIINDHYDHEDKISEGFVAFVLVISYLSLLFLFAYLFVDESHPIARVSNLVDRVSAVAYLVWGFKARKRMNIILCSERKTKMWFHGLWTFLFTPFYFNFKVNQLNEEAEQALGGYADNRSESI
ncbi:MAG: hypothetical protein AAGD22_07200 [Verrucomicrobiota bacterium]